MESSIPAHLRVARTEPSSMRDDWNPPSPAFSARFPASVDAVVMAYFGLQYRDRYAAEVREARSDLAARIGATDGPVHYDTAVVTDGAGFTNEITALYWLDQDQYFRWDATHASWTGPERRCDEIGVFQEIALPGMLDLETIVGGRRLEGIAAASAGTSGDIAEHAYWGSMRDRLPSSQTSRLESTGVLRFERTGDHVAVHPHDGIALIRSGQDWADTVGVPRQRWLNDIQPVLQEGMDFLTADGVDVGCYSNRLVRLSADGELVEKTYGHGWWRSLADLERWSRSHRTHLKIFGAFGQFLQEFGGSQGLRLYHEVCVLKAEELRFEYLGCHERTGLLNAQNAGA